MRGPGCWNCDTARYGLRRLVLYDARVAALQGHVHQRQPASGVAPPSPRRSLTAIGYDPPRPSGPSANASGPLGACGQNPLRRPRLLILDRIKPLVQQLDARNNPAPVLIRPVHQEPVPLRGDNSRAAPSTPKHQNRWPPSSILPPSRSFSASVSLA